MCKIVEEYAEEYAKRYAAEQRRKGVIEGRIKTVEKMVDEGVALDKALWFADLDRQTYEKYLKER